MLQVYVLVFQMYVARVSYGCCKSRLRCCICCNGCTRMLQASISNVSSVFSDVCCNCVYLDVAYVSHICFKCFILMLRMFYNGFQLFSRRFFASVSEACFIYLQTYVTSVVFGCFENISSVTSPSSPSATSPWCLLFAFCCLASFLILVRGCAGGRRRGHARGWTARSPFHYVGR